jgi:glycosyltransferase involved in cell wall biosynthesis
VNPPFSTSVHRIAVLGNFPPRQCGIATFTRDLVTGIRAADPMAEVDVVALNDGPYEYKLPVKWSIDMADEEAYPRVAEFLNRAKYDILCVQHEFGIFGGSDGSHLLQLMRNVNMPIVTTLHTVLDNPSLGQRAVFNELLELSERVVVMGRKGEEILTEVYDVPRSKIDEIPHGIHKVDRQRAIELRQKHGLEGRPVILTFGLLGYDKGIHDMVEAMANIVKDHPDAIYLVVGATHPHLKAKHGEEYRERLIARTSELGLQDNIVFVNRYVSESELAGWLAVADIYVTPYLKPHQITSGTLAYAVGSGCAVVSTPYWHAQELLEDGRGVLVSFNSPPNLAATISRLLGNEDERKEMAGKAFEYGRSMRWPVVGKVYQETFVRAKKGSADRLTKLVRGRSEEPLDRPKLVLDHLVSLSDDTGLLQHATYLFPNRNEGYCTDDNARAAVLVTRCIELNGLTFEARSRLERLQSTYISFLMHAFDRESGRYRNFMSYDRQWLERIGSDDSHARAMLAFGTHYRMSHIEGQRGISQEIGMLSIPGLLVTTSPRGWANGILALAEFHKANPQLPVLEPMRELANRIAQLYRANRTEDWPWFEASLAHANPVLSHAMLVAGEILGDDQLLQIGLESLAWLQKQQTAPNGYFAPVGCCNDWQRGGKRPWFDQQPIEAASAVSACLAAAQATHDHSWISEANRSFNWFVGKNMLRIAVANTKTGSCCDGLTEHGLNQNCGAESTLAYLTSLAELHEYWRTMKPQIEGARHQ